jgi:hypothetical protein
MNKQLCIIIIIMTRSSTSSQIRERKAACNANGLELLPICIESTGARWGKACDDFFKKVLKANRSEQRQ